MANDVNEHVFNEKQLYASDVIGEDGEPSFGGSSAPLARSATLSTGRAVASKASGGSAAQERRKKKAAERATQIVYWLESKYEILPEVCSSFQNWKEAPSATYDFDLLWCDQAIPADRFMKLKPYQKMNHFVGMSSITRKNNLGRNLLRMRKQYPKEYRFFPDTWILPTDLSDFKLQFSSAKNKTFIIKPDNGCQGKGIFLIRDVEKVPVDFSTTFVAQRYVHRPFLLDGYKFDLRLYVLVAGCDPLRIFLHKRGLVRLASEQYVEPAGKNLSQSMVHLTNYAINKMNPNFEENTNPDDAQDGHKRSWEAVHEHLRKDGHDVDTLLAEIEDLIVKTLIAVQPSLSHFYHSCQPDDVENAMCFEILGFDIILDQKLRPVLLEVNHAPSFATESELDRVVKDEVLRDTFALLDISPEARRQKKREAREKMEQRAMGVAKKQSLGVRMEQEQDIALRRTAWEDGLLNGYKRLYPSEEKERQYMQIHDAAISIWEMLMGGTSRRSVRLTQQAGGDDEEGPERRPADRAAGERRGGAQGRGGSKERRTAEELREVAERLMAGCSARPRAKGAGRNRGPNTTAAPNAGIGGVEDEVGEQAPAQAIVQPQLQKHGLAAKTEVQVGDIIKVQTNLGWESVAVRAKRTNGKVDIQFRDGEYMRSVLPRILRESVPGTWGKVGEVITEADGSVSGRHVPVLASSSVAQAQCKPGRAPNSGGASNASSSAGGGGLAVGRAPQLPQPTQPAGGGLAAVGAGVGTAAATAATLAPSAAPPEQLAASAAAAALPPRISLGDPASSGAGAGAMAAGVGAAAPTAAAGSAAAAACVGVRAGALWGSGSSTEGVSATMTQEMLHSLDEQLTSQSRVQRSRMMSQGQEVAQDPGVLRGRSGSVNGVGAGSAGAGPLRGGSQRPLLHSTTAGPAANGTATPATSALQAMQEPVARGQQARAGQLQQLINVRPIVTRRTGESGDLSAVHREGTLSSGRESTRRHTLGEK